MCNQRQVTGSRCWDKTFLLWCHQLSWQTGNALPHAPPAHSQWPSTFYACVWMCLHRIYLNGSSLNHAWIKKDHLTKRLHRGAFYAQGLLFHSSGKCSQFCFIYISSFGEIKIETIEIIIVKIIWFWKNLKKNVSDFWLQIWDHEHNEIWNVKQWHF